jgi:hypothetical protein
MAAIAGAERLAERIGWQSIGDFRSMRRADACQFDAPSQAYPARPLRIISGFRLIVVLGVLTILVGLSLPRALGRTAVARVLADIEAIDQVGAALSLKHADHRATDAPPEHWIADLGEIARILPGGRLPPGLVLAHDRLVDQRGQRYVLIPETLTSPAMLTRDW